MINSGVLDVVIGLVFIYLLYSLLTTLVQEIIATRYSFRSKILERAIFRMLEDDHIFQNRFKSVFYLFRKQGNGGKKGSLTFAFYDHPLIKFLGENEHHSKPEYIRKETFSKVMVDLLRGNEVQSTDELEKLVQKSLMERKTNWSNAKIGDETYSYLNSIWIDSSRDVAKFRENLEDWFELTMERASEWYKRHVQILLFFIGFGIAFIFNVDTLIIVEKLEKDPKLREQLVQQTEAFTSAYPNLDEDLKSQQAEVEQLWKQVSEHQNPADDGTRQLYFEAKEKLERSARAKVLREHLIIRADSLMNVDIKKANDVIGLGLNSYGQTFHNWRSFAKSLVGWTVTALALSLGAPFWFDLLNKLMKLRSAVTGAASEKQQKNKGKP